MTDGTGTAAEGTSFEVAGLADMHAHLRQGPLMGPVIRDHVAGGTRVILAMPNTSPPVDRATRSCDGDGLSVPEYLDMVMAAGGDAFEAVLPTLYLTRHATPSGIARATAERGPLRVKYYPPHGTTGSGHSMPIGDVVGSEALRALEAEGGILLVHGEMHGVSGEDWFGRASNAEEAFYREWAPRLRDAHPGLRVVAEHITTRVALEAARDLGFGATVTPMHLLHEVGTLLQGWYAHLKCMPILKWRADVEALRAAVVDPANTFLFAGTDSAPHPKLAKATDCGCASGCYLAPVALQMYAQAFEEAGVDMGSAGGQAAFRSFTAERGPDFHGTARPGGRFTLAKRAQEVRPTPTEAGELVPLPVGMVADREGRSATVPWTLEG